MRKVSIFIISIAISILCSCSRNSNIAHQPSESMAPVITSPSSTVSNTQFVYAFNGATFDWASDFDAGYAQVRLAGVNYIIDTDGNIILKLPNVTEFGNIIGVAGDDIKYTYRGKGITYVDFSRYSDHTSWHYLIDTQGIYMQTSIPSSIVYDPNYFFNNNQIIVETYGSFPYVNTIMSIDGNYIIPTLDPMTNIIYLGNVQFGYYDNNKKLVLPGGLNFVGDYNQIYEIQVHGAQSEPISATYIDNYGNNVILNNEVFTADYQEPIGTEENMLIFFDGVAKTDRGYVTMDGKQFGDSSWQYMHNFNENYAAIKVNDLWGYVDKDGNIVVEPQFDYALDVRNGLALIHTNKGTQYIIIGDPSIDKDALNSQAISIDNSDDSAATNPNNNVPSIPPLPLPKLNFSLYTGTLEDVEKINPIGANASSELTGEGILYGAGSAIDSDFTTAWQEDSNGNGIGETITVYFKEETAISLIYLRLGFAKSDTSYANNGKPSELKFEFSDGTSMQYSFPEVNEDFYLNTGAFIRTSYIKITILGAYPGAKWEDTSISEIAAYSSIYDES